VLKLLDILDDLKKASEIGVFHFLQGADDNSFCITVDAESLYGSGVPLRIFGLGFYEQALIIAALEQWVESKGHWFEFGYQPSDVHFAWICHKEKDYAKANGYTRLQAALKCFLEVFGEPQ
jgi:hypothetical protein